MDLPLRPQQVVVPVDPDGKIRFILNPMDDMQLLVLFGMDVEKLGDNERQEQAQELADEVQGSGATRVFDLARNAHGGLKKVLAETLKKVEDADDPNGLTVEGGPFDPNDERHFFALPFLWRVKLLEGMVNQGFSMTEKMVGNSEERGSPSLEASAPTPH